jgi:UDP-glucose 4-epimerase
MAHKSALITGGAGFVGSHLSEFLMGLGMSVTIIDDLSTGSWSNVKHLSDKPGFRAIISPASDEGLIAKEVERHDVVYHLAAAVGVKLILAEPVRSIASIFNTTEVIAKACVRYRKPLVVTSTSEVYGASTDIPFKEDAHVVMGPTCTARWSYACAKALDEFLVLGHHRKSALDVYIARLFNTVGPRQSSQYGMVLPTFVKQAMAGDDITVYGSGDQSRCFCSVSDVVRGLHSLSESEGAVGQVVNLGSDVEITINDLAKRVKKVTNSKSKIVYVPYAKAYGDGFEDMKRRVPDLSRARKYLGWTTERDIDKIVLSVRWGGGWKWAVEEKPIG